MKNILIADRDKLYANSLKQQLQQYGFNIFTAESLHDAEEAAKLNNIDTSIIDLIDQNDDSGFVLAYRLRKKNPSMPIIIITAMSAKSGIYFNPESEREQKWLNSNVYLDKNSSIEHILKEVLKLLKV